MTTILPDLHTRLPRLSTCPAGPTKRAFRSTAIRSSVSAGEQYQRERADQVPAELRRRRHQRGRPVLLRLRRPASPGLPHQVRQRPQERGRPHSPRSLTAPTSIVRAGRSPARRPPRQLRAGRAIPTHRDLHRPLATVCARRLSRPQDALRGESQSERPDHHHLQRRHHLDRHPRQGPRLPARLPLRPRLAD